MHRTAAACVLAILLAPSPALSLAFLVLSGDEWQDTGFDVTAGQLLVIEASGSVIFKAGFTPAVPDGWPDPGDHQFDRYPHCNCQLHRLIPGLGSGLRHLAKTVDTQRGCIILGYHGGLAGRLVVFICLHNYLYRPTLAASDHVLPIAGDIVIAFVLGSILGLGFS